MPEINDYNKLNIKNPDGILKEFNDFSAVRPANASPAFIKESGSVGVNELSREQESQPINQVKSSETKKGNLNLITGNLSHLAAVTGVAATTIASVIIAVVYVIVTFTVNVSLVLSNATSLVFFIDMNDSKQLIATLSYEEEAEPVFYEQEVFGSDYIVFSNLKANTTYTLTLTDGETGEQYSKNTYRTLDAETKSNILTYSVMGNELSGSVDFTDFTSANFFTVQVTDSYGKVLYAFDGTATNSEFKTIIEDVPEVFITVTVNRKVVAFESVLMGSAYDLDNIVWDFDNFEDVTATLYRKDGGEPVVLHATTTEPIFTEPTCEEDGGVSLTATAEFEGMTFTKDYVDVEPALGHYGERVSFPYNYEIRNYTTGEIHLLDNGRYVCERCHKDVEEACKVEGSTVDPELGMTYTISCGGQTEELQLFADGMFMDNDLIYKYEDDIEEFIIMGSLIQVENYDYPTERIPLTVREAFMGYPLTKIVGNAFTRSTFTDIVVQDNIIDIEYNAFDTATQLVSITLPDTITTLKHQVFSNCVNLEEINISYGLTTVESNAFEYCQRLTELTLPDSVTEIYDGAFRYMPALQSLTIPFVGTSKSATQGEATTLGIMFSQSDSMDDYYEVVQYYNAEASLVANIPYSLSEVTVTGGTIYRGAFDNCQEIMSVTVGDDVSVIYTNAFDGCELWLDLPSNSVWGLYDENGDRYNAENYTPDDINDLIYEFREYSYTWERLN